MSIPSNPSFEQTAKRLADLVKELDKNIKPAKPVFQALKNNSGMARNLTDVAKRAKYIEEEFFLNRGKAGTALKRVASEAKKNVSNIEKVLNPLKKVNDLLVKGAFKQINPAWGARLGAFTGLLSSGLTVLSIKTNEEIQAIDLANGQRIEADLQNTFTRSINNSIKIRGLEKLFTSNKISVNDTLSSQAKQIYENKINIREAAKKANDSLYEVRQGRQKLESQISDARKLSNDALYETRQGRQKLESQISALSTQVKQALQGINSNFQSQITTTITNIQKSLQDAQSQVNNQNKIISTLQATVSQVKPTEIINSVVDKAKAFFNPQIIELKNQISSLKISTDTSIKQTNQNSQQLEQKFGVTVKTYEGVTQSLRDTYNQSFEAQAAKWNEQIRQQNNEIKKVTASVNTTNNTTQLKTDLDKAKADLEKVKIDVGKTKIDLDKVDSKLKEQEKVNNAALPKLEGIAFALGLIPAKVAETLKPNLLTKPDIENAAATGVCRSTQPGGCMNRALNDNANDIKTNNNNNAGSILDAVNTGANAALLAGQETILARLGAQLPGGIGGKLERFSKWLHLDRVLNMMIWATTIHNALMLSNDIGRTLLSAISNIFQLFGLTDSEGQAFDLGTIFNSSIENIIKGMIGADNYTQLRETWAKSVRVYQATTNVLNSFLNLSQTILQASELIAAYTGRIGNALKKGGVILENAYGWMNPQPKFNRITTFLEGLQNGASTIQMVTQAPLDVVNATTEFTTASTEFVKAVKEDDKPENKATPTPEPDELKAKEAQSKSDSQPLAFDFSDLFDGED